MKSLRLHVADACQAPHFSNVWCSGGTIANGADACQAPHFSNVWCSGGAIANGDPNQNGAALEQRAKACVQSAIQWFLRKFNVDL